VIHTGTLHHTLYREGKPWCPTQVDDLARQRMPSKTFRHPTVAGQRWTSHARPFDRATRVTNFTITARAIRGNGHLCCSNDMQL